MGCTTTFKKGADIEDNAERLILVTAAPTDCCHKPKRIVKMDTTLGTNGKKQS